MNDPVFNRLFPYQREHLNSLALSFDVNPCTIDSSDTGTGKTYTSAALCRLKNRRALVICPKPVVENWYSVFEQFGVRILGTANYEAIKNGKYYASIEMFRSDKRVQCPYIEVIRDGTETDFEWDLPDDAVVIFDEAHNGKNNITINSQLLVSTKKIISAAGVKILILSATITDKIECFRVAAHLLGFSQYGKHAYRVWLRKLSQQYSGVNQIEAIHRMIYPRFGSRMRIRDIKSSEDVNVNVLFKENYIRVVTVDMSPDVESEIETAHNYIQDALTQLKAKLITAGCYLTILLRERQRIETLKIPTFVMWAMEQMLNGNSVVIFTNFRETITKLFQELDKFVQDEFQSFITFIHGDQTPDERNHQITEFQRDRSRLILVNMRAGKMGLSLHDLHGNFPRVALHFPTWSGIDFKQAIGRIYRADAKTDANQYVIYCRGRASAVGPANGKKSDATFNGENGEKISIDELQAEIANKKLKTIAELNDGDDYFDDLIQI